MGIPTREYLQSRRTKSSIDRKMKLYSMIFLVTLMVMVALTSAESDCHKNYHDQASCNAVDGCGWCLCGALPSSCFSEDEAKRLPPAVFNCNTKSVNPLLWRSAKGLPATCSNSPNQPKNPKNLPII